MIQTQCKSQLFRKTNLHSNEHPERKSPKQERSRILNILFCALFAISGALCSGWSKQSAVDAYNKGLEFYKKGQAQKAAERFRKAAEQGYAPAQYNLGVCYAKGQGVAQNYAEAVKWYSKAAEQGNKYAQNNLGVCYCKGQGVAQNYAEAVKWFTKAAEQGDAPSMYLLGLMYAQGTGVEADKQMAIQWLTKAANKGFKPAREILNKIE